MSCYDASAVCAGHEVFIPSERLHDLSNGLPAKVKYTGQKFVVIRGGREIPIQPIDLSPVLRGIPIEKLQELFSSASFQLRRDGDEYSLSMYVLLRGGGPVAGAIGYAATKAVCYGIACAGAASIVPPSGGASGGFAGALGAAATAGATPGAGAVGGAVAGAGYGNEAALTTVALTTGAAGVAGGEAVVEGLAACVGYALGTCPWLP